MNKSSVRLTTEPLESLISLLLDLFLIDSPGDIILADSVINLFWLDWNFICLK